MRANVWKRGAALALAAMWFPAMFLALAETPKEKLDRWKEEQRRTQEKIEQAEQRQEDAATLKTLYQEKANSILAQIDALNEQMRQQKSQVEAANTALAAAQQQLEAGREAFEKRLVAMYETRYQSNLSALLGAKDFSQMMRFAENLTCISVANKAQVDGYVQAKQTLEQQAAEQQALLDDMQKTSAQLEQTRQEYAAAIRQADEELSQAQADQQSYEAAYEEATDQVEQATKEYLEWIAQDDNPNGQAPEGGWLWPLPGYAAGSPYGWRTLNGRPDFHRGVDIPAPAMTPIRAAVGGVVSVQRHSSYGNCVKVSVGGGVVVIYAHMTCWASDLSNDMAVEAGHILGYVGTTGNSFGNHLHFEVDINGQPVQPLDYVSPG